MADANKLVYFCGGVEESLGRKIEKPASLTSVRLNFRGLVKRITRGMGNRGRKVIKENGLEMSFYIDHWRFKVGCLVSTMREESRG